MEQDPVTGEWRPAPWIKAVQTGASFIPGWGQLTGAALGVISLAYINFRKGKGIDALVDGIEAFRVKLRQTDQGRELDEQFLDLLKKVQDERGVQKLIHSVVDKRTDYTRNPTRIT